MFGSRSARKMDPGVSNYLGLLNLVGPAVSLENEYVYSACVVSDSFSLQ